VATYPIDPALPAMTASTEVSVTFLNTLIDNINAIGEALGDLQNNTADGNIDLDSAKGIEWADTLKIYFSGGDIIIDDGVQISGGLDVAGTLTVDTITDSGAGAITVSQDVVFAAGKYIDAPTGKFDTIDDSGAATISCLEDFSLSTGKVLSTDYIQDSGAGTVEIQEDVKIYRGSGAITLEITEGGISDVLISSDRYMEIGQHSGTPGDSSIDAWIIWQDTSGNLKTKLRESSATKTKTLMPYNPSAYTVTNDITDRTYDADATSTAELADVLGTLIADLQTLGLIG
jgi:hypothetical protein